MKILLLESFYASSHKQWVDGLIRFSKHDIHLISLPGRHWKWRMHHAGNHFAQKVAMLKEAYDLILCSDLMNVAEFRGVLAALGNKETWFNNIPVVTYFHENQITYPWSENDPDIRLKRDNHYGWINYISCVSSNHILFNSEFHKTNFINALSNFLKQFPDSNRQDLIIPIHNKSNVLPVGLNLRELTKVQKYPNPIPIILWNHRWEYDKNPELFFQTLFKLHEENYAFQVIIAGEAYKKYPKIFDTAKEKLKEKIIHFGYAADRQEYQNLLLKSDILPVTSNQDFFGISAIEAIAAGCIPLLPNRLAFPEHLTGPEFEKYYYKSSEALTDKIEEIIAARSYDSASLRTHILKYDWEIVAPAYDHYFEKLVYY